MFTLRTLEVADSRVKKGSESFSSCSRPYDKAQGSALANDRGNMKFKSKAVVGAVAVTALAATSFTGASADEHNETSLAEVLDVGNQAFDHNWDDHDILTAAINAVLEAKPESPVSALADGSTELTAFIPDDRSFRRLVINLTGSVRSLESSVFNDIAGLGIDTVEEVLLYHVVIGPAIDSAAALASGGASLTTAEGQNTIVNVVDTSIELVDKDTGLNNPRVFLDQIDINSGNKQIAHGIDRIMLPFKVTD